jgi:hypothetical protein
VRLAQRLAPAAGAQPARRQRLSRRRQGLRVEEEKGKNLPFFCAEFFGSGSVLDPDSIRPVGPDPYSESGSRRAKMTRSWGATRPSPVSHSAPSGSLSSGRKRYKSAGCWTGTEIYRDYSRPFSLQCCARNILTVLRERLSRSTLRVEEEKVKIGRSLWTGARMIPHDERHCHIGRCFTWRSSQLLAFCICFLVASILVT